MRMLVRVFLVFLFPTIVFAKDPAPPEPLGELLIREVRYDGRLTDTEARFVVEIDAESTTRGEAMAPLFELSPPTATRAGSSPRRVALATTHRRPA